MDKEIKVKETVDLKLVDEIIARWGSDEAYLIPMMQDIQGKYNYLPRPALLHIQEKLNLPLTRVAEVASFYKAFSLKPKGKHLVHVCLGTACHLKGGPRIVDAFRRELNVEVDETTKDRLFTLQTVNCVGACALAPVVIIDGNVSGRQEPSKVKMMVSRVRKAEGGAEAGEEGGNGGPGKAKSAAAETAQAAKKPSAKPKSAKIKKTGKSAKSLSKSKKK